MRPEEARAVQEILGTILPSWESLICQLSGIETMPPTTDASAKRKSKTIARTCSVCRGSGEELLVFNDLIPVRSANSTVWKESDLNSLVQTKHN